MLGAEPESASFVEKAMMSGFEFLRCAFAAMVTAVSVMPWLSFAMVFPVQGAIMSASIGFAGPSGSASAMEQTGFAPHNAFAIATMREAMRACRAKGVENVVMTMWGDNGAECSKFAVLPALFMVAQMARGIDDEETIHANFEKEFGIPFEDFRALDLAGTQNDSAEAIYNPEKYLLYCDPFMGQFDNRVKPADVAGYANCAARLAKHEHDADYGYLFRSLHALCNFLNIKADLGIRTRVAYLSGDKKAAKALCNAYDTAVERLADFYAAYEQQWMHENKPQGFDVVDLRIGGQRQRLTIARALVPKPKILILDDSASALDFATDAALRKAIKEETHGMTVFIVSQRAASVQRADHILVLDDGKLVGDAPHAELLRSCEVYKEICLSQLSKEEVAKTL